jgi:hypothetical protein
MCERTIDHIFIILAVLYSVLSAVACVEGVRAWLDCGMAVALALKLDRGAKAQQVLRVDNRSAVGLNWRDKPKGKQV